MGARSVRYLGKIVVLYYRLIDYERDLFRYSFKVINYFMFSSLLRRVFITMAFVFSPRIKQNSLGIVKIYLILVLVQWHH